MTLDLGHPVAENRRNYDKASFCVIDKDDVQPEKYTTPVFRKILS